MTSKGIFNMKWDCAKPAKLKPETIPSVHPNSKIKHGLSENSSNPLDSVLRKEIIQSLLEESNSADVRPSSPIAKNKNNCSAAANTSTTHSHHSTVQHRTVPPLGHDVAGNIKSIIVSVNSSCKDHEKKINSLEEEVSKLQSVIREKCKEMNTLNMEIKRVEFERNNLEENLSTISTIGQIKNLKNGMKRQLWKKEDIDFSITLYLTSAKAYKLLREKNFHFLRFEPFNAGLPKITFLEVF